MQQMRAAGRTALSEGVSLIPKIVLVIVPLMIITGGVFTGTAEAQTGDRARRTLAAMGNEQIDPACEGTSSEVNVIGPIDYSLDNDIQFVEVAQDRENTLVAVFDQEGGQAAEWTASHCDTIHICTEGDGEYLCGGSDGVGGSIPGGDGYIRLYANQQTKTVSIEFVREGP